MSLANARERTYEALSVLTYDAPAPTLSDHLFGCVFVAQHYTARVHYHLLIERFHRSCVAWGDETQTHTPLQRRCHIPSLTFQELFQNRHASIGHHLHVDIDVFSGQLCAGKSNRDGKGEGGERGARLERKRVRHVRRLGYPAL